MRCTAAALLTLLLTAPPSLAFEIEEIGTIDAIFDATTISQPTVIAGDGDEASATAFLFLTGVSSALSIAGYGPDNARLSVEVDFMTQTPGPEAAPLSTTVSYAPGGGGHWTSEDAPSAPAVSFTTLEADDKEGRAVGSFAAELCFAEGYEGGGDPGNCRMIEGRFDTAFVVER